MGKWLYKGATVRWFPYEEVAMACLSGWSPDRRSLRRPSSTANAVERVIEKGDLLTNGVHPYSTAGFFSQLMEVRINMAM